MRGLLPAHPSEPTGRPVRRVCRRGYVRGNTAVLLVNGESIAGKLVGEALLMKEKDAWRVDDELIDLDLR